MDDPHQTSAGSRPPNGRLPDVNQAAALHAQVAEVLRVLQAASEFAQSGQGVGRPRILARFGGRVEAAMLALGETLAGFLFAGDSPADLNALRAGFLEPILALSRSLAVYNRAEEWSRHKEKTGELHPLVLEGRAVGFDPETLLLDDFYKNTIFVRALRSRISVLARFFLEEAAHRAAESRDLRVLIVGANSILQLGSPFPEG